MLSSSWPGSATSFRLRAQAAAATTASDETAGWSRLTSNRWFARGRRPQDAFACVKLDPHVPDVPVAQPACRSDAPSVGMFFVISSG
jgi:hypothetical protein